MKNKSNAEAQPSSIQDIISNQGQGKKITKEVRKEGEMISSQVDKSSTQITPLPEEESKKQGNVEMLLELIATKAVYVGLCNGVSNTSSGELVPQKMKALLSI